MKCSDIISKYLKGLNSKITFENTPNGCIVSFPFFNPNNEVIMAFVECAGEKYRISDMSQADEFLFLHGLDIKPNSKAEWYYQDILRRFDVRSNDSELYVEVDEDNLVSGFNAIIGAINSIDHLIYTLSPRLSPDFHYEVSKWLTEEKIKYRERVEIVRGVKIHFKLDFEIQRREKIPIFMQTLHAAIKQSALNQAFKWDFNQRDMLKAGYQFHSVAMLDDSLDGNIWETAYPILENSTNTVLYWNDRNLLKELVAGS